MNGGNAIAVAIAFAWLGLIIAISFIEAPLKFRAPGVTLQIGLGIGRLVFRALNTVEAILAVVLVVALLVGSPSTAAVIAMVVAVAALAAQLLGVRPLLTKRSDAVLAGGGPGTASGTSTRSRVHYVYVALELVKVVALLVGGIALLTA